MFLVIFVGTVLLPSAVIAQGPLPRQEPGDPATAKPGLLSRIGIDQRLNEQVPLDLSFVDESGREVKLREYFGKRPVLLALVYYECPMLCTQVLNGVTGALKVLNFDVGKEFDVVAVSINPREGPGLAAAKKQAYLDRYGRPHTAAGWHFLTGREENIRALANAVGFRYEYDEEIKQYAHGAGVELLTPTGLIARYFYGIEYSQRDIRLGIVEAADEKIGSAIDHVMLLCYHYDPTTGKYGTTVITM
ncbi:MAG: SCO family protein, partial [Acidobacteria bacterium]|nr:SCO family protein [Acidobacteriota bacterium]